MNVGNLRVFMAIYDTGSVSRAAKLLGISQSGASNSLNKIRDELNDTLFVKTHAGMQPTAKAQSIIPAVRSAVQTLNEVLTDRQEFDPSTSAGEFCIVAGDILEATVALCLALEFANSAPSARLRCMSLDPSEIEEAMSSAKVDLCVGNFSHFGPNVMETTVAKFTYACFCSPRHPFAGRNISLEEFSKARYVLMDEDCSISNTVEKWLQAHNIKRNIVARTTHFSSIPILMEMADLIAIVPTDMSKNWLFSGNTSKLELPFELPTAEIKLYWHQVMHKDMRNQWIRRTLLQKLKRVSLGGPDYGLWKRTESL